MRSLSSALKARMADNATITARASILFADGERVEVPGSRVFSLSLERASSSDSSFDIGAAVMSQLDITIGNSDGWLDSRDLTGATLTAWVGAGLPDGTTEWVKLGVFNVDQPDSYSGRVSLTCLDNLSRLERPVTDVTCSLPCTVAELAQAICDRCGVVLAPTEAIPNGDLVVPSTASLDDTDTCLDAIGWVAQATGTYAICDGDGVLHLSWYDPEAISEEGEAVDGHPFVTVRACSSITVLTDDVVVTGVRVTAQNEVADDGGIGEDGETALYGSEGYVLSVEGNKLIGYGMAADVAQRVGRRCVGLRFRPFEATCISNLEAEPGDPCMVTDLRGNAHMSYVTRVSLNANSSMTVACSAEAAARNSAASASAATKAVVAAREEAKREAEARREAQRRADEAASTASEAASKATEAQGAADRAALAASAAQGAADKAREGAENAQATADAAKATAASAKSTADAASASATAAQEAADAAAEGARAAQSTADAAKANAAKASQAASDADEAASRAASAASAAQSTADAAKAGAEKAQGDLAAAQKALEDVQSQADATDEEVAAAKAAVEAAQATADKAKADAATASSAAATAKSAADDATKWAEDARAKATEAASGAAKAQETADAARANASAAQSTADAAKANAATASTAASRAQEAADAAQSTADAAKADASAAQSTADTAKADAAAAQGTADAAATEASNARLLAEEAKDKAEKAQSAVDAVSKQLAEQIATSSGLFTTSEAKDDGSYVWYMHDKATLADSQVVWKFAADVIAVSNDGQKTWVTALNSDGMALLQRIYAVGINADFVTAGRLQSRDGATYIDLDSGEARISSSTIVGGRSFADTIAGLEDADRAATDAIAGINDNVDQLFRKTSYVTIGEDADHNPELVLGTNVSDFSLRITNEAIKFMQGTVAVAYINNQQLYITRSIVVDELMMGNGAGFAWRRRQNGHLGLRYMEG